MSIIEAVVLGAVQGLTEFLPISSTAHLILVPKALGWADPGLTFDVALHAGTLVALLIYFWKDWLNLVMSGIDYLRGRGRDPLFFYIMFGTIPAGIAGLLLEDMADRELRDLRVIGTTLIVLAVVLVAAEILGRRKKHLAEMSFADAMAVGCAQALAVVPGVSRSGVTITAGLFRGMTREAAARFSFFLSTPLIAAAVAKKFLEIAQAGGVPSGDVGSFITGIVVSGLVGFASIAILLRYLQNHSTYAFIYYRIALGVILFLAFFRGFR